mgnify:CR=1 FL=1
MWEYAVLHEHDRNWVVVQSEGIAKSYIRVKFQTPITKGWKGRANSVWGGGDIKVTEWIVKHSEDVIWFMYRERSWNAENPCWGLRTDDDRLKLFKNKSNKNYKKWNGYVIEVFGAEVEHAECVVEGLTLPIYEAETVTQVLSKAGLDGWELVGNVPSGSNRMLRRQLS